MKKMNVNWTYWRNRFIFCMSVILAMFALLNCRILVAHLGGFLHILSPFMIGFIIAYLLNGIQKFFKNWIERIPIRLLQSHSHSLSILTLYISIIIVIFIILSLLIPLIIKNVNDLILALPQIQEIISNYIDALGEKGVIKEVPTEHFISEMTSLFSTKRISSNWQQIILSLGGMTKNFSDFILNTFLSFVVSIYVLVYKDSILLFTSMVCKKLMSETVFKKSKKLIHTVHVVFYKFICSQILDACMIWLLSTIILTIFQIKYAIILSLLLGICNMIPYFGSIFASLLTGIVTLFTGGVSKAITILLVLLVLQQIDGNIIGPRIMGDALNINPIVIIVSITIGGAYFGILGMFLAVPIAAILKTIISEWLYG